MVANLMSRIEKLEASSQPEKPYPKVVRLVTHDEEEAEAARLAAEGSDDIFIIRLIAPSQGRLPAA